MRLLGWLAFAAAAAAPTQGRAREAAPWRIDYSTSAAPALEDIFGLGGRSRRYALPAASTGTAVLPPPAPEPARRDLRLVWHYRKGLRRVLDFAAASPQAFGRDPGTRTWLDEDRALALRTWDSALDYLLALDMVVRHNAAAWGAKPRDRDARAELAAGYAAWLGTYRWVSEWAARCDRDASLVELLDKPAPELGLPAGTYARLKAVLASLRGRGAFEAGREQYLALKARDALEWAIGAAAARELEAELEEEARALRGRGSRRAGGGFRLASWLEAWSSEARAPDLEWIVAVSTICDPYRWQSLEERLRPGDIVLVRREPFLGDAGLPGWWNAAAINVGTARERRRAFGWPEPSGRAGKPPACPARFLAATERGVRPRTMRELAAMGPLAVLRPRVSAEAKGAAVRRAFAYLGAPYNFAFDLGSRTRAAGAELVFQAYASPGGESLRLPVGETLGRPTASANDLAETFDGEFGLSSQRFELVWFLDEGGVPSSLEEFRRTWRRSKWNLKSGGNHERT